MSVCRKQRCGENTHDDPIGPSGQSASTDGSGNDFRSIIRLFLIAFAVFGIYTPKWNHHIVVFKNLSIKVALLIHRAYCLSIVIMTWVIVGKSNSGLLQVDSGTTFLYQLMLLITSCQFGCTGAMFLWASMRGRYIYMIDAFDIVIVDGFDRLKKLSIAFIIGALLSASIALICTIFSISWGVTLFVDSNNSTIYTNPSDMFSNGELLFMSCAAIYACFIVSFPTIFFSFLCFILSTRFESSNKALREILTSDLDTDDLNKKLLGLRTDHANICNAVRHTDNLFSPILFIMFAGTIANVCMLLYLLSEDKSVMAFLFGIILNSMSMLLLVGSSSKVHNRVSTFC